MNAIKFSEGLLKAETGGAGPGGIGTLTLGRWAGLNAPSLNPTTEPPVEKKSPRASRIRF